MAILYIVATPIGNLSDITIRAIETLRKADFILCEDARITQKLLGHYRIKTPTLSYHQHSRLKKVNYILELLKKGKNLALVSDAGTPGISDPGNKLISEILETENQNTLRLQSISTVKIVSVPGASALTAAASVSGFQMDKFLFLGFPPTKKKRKKFFEKIVKSKYSVIFYESPHRILKTLKELRSFIHEVHAQIRLNSRKVVVCRELTKKFETIYRGTIQEIIKEIEKDEIKGEFVVIVGQRK